MHISSIRLSKSNSTSRPRLVSITRTDLYTCLSHAVPTRFLRCWRIFHFSVGLLCSLVPSVSLATSPDDAFLEASPIDSPSKVEETRAAAYRKSLAQDPQNDEVRAKLAQALAWSGQYHEAEQLYHDILTRHPNDSDVLTALARVKAWRGDYPAAERLYEGVLAVDAENEDARRGLADTLYWNGHFVRALAEYKRLSLAHPSAELTQRIAEVQTAQDRLTQSQQLRAPVGASSARPALPFRDYLKAGYGHFPYTNNIADERHFLLEGAHAFGAQTAVVRVEPTDRFGLTDVPISGELYSTLWSKAWGYISGGVTPNARFMADYSLGGEVYQSLGVLSSALSALEPSFGYRHLQFKSEGVDLLMPGMVLYLPFNLWLTEKIYWIPTTGAITLSSMLTWRPTERVQAWISGGFGTASERIFAEQDFVRVPSKIFQAGIIFPLSESFSAEALGLYEDRESLYKRQGGMLNLLWHY